MRFRSLIIYRENQYILLQTKDHSSTLLLYRADKEKKHEVLTYSLTPLLDLLNKPKKKKDDEKRHLFLLPEIEEKRQTPIRVINQSFNESTHQTIIGIYVIPLGSIFLLVSILLLISLCLLVSFFVPISFLLLISLFLLISSFSLILFIPPCSLLSSSSSFPLLIIITILKLLMEIVTLPHRSWR